MSSIVTDQGMVHYETFGSGRPVILLHGWIESWGVWQATMEALSQEYRCYALDFWGFGESGKKRGSYAVSDYMELVRQFMDVLGIAQAPIVGHSMGGTAALGAAVRNPERITSVCVIGSPIVGSALSPFLKVAGEPWAGSLAHAFLPGLKLAIRLAAPAITRDPRWYDMVARDLSATTVESFFGSIRSLRRTDLRPRLPELKIPVMGIYGSRDVIVDPHEYEPLRAGVPQARIEVLPNSGHFPMLDEPERYLTLVRSFLGQPTSAVSASG